MASSVNDWPIAFRMLFLAFCFAAAPTGVCQDSMTTTPPQYQPSLSEGLAKLTERKYQEAAEVLADVVAAKQLTLQQMRQRPEMAMETARETQQLQQAMIGAGSALRQLGRQGEAFEFFDAAVQLLAQHPPANSSLHNSLHTIQLAAAECAAGAGKHEQAIHHCQGIIDEIEITTTPNSIESLPTETTSILTAARRTVINSSIALKQTKQAWEHFEKAVGIESANNRDWQELAISIGLAALSGNEPVIAQIAFRWYLKHATEVDSDNPLNRETAILGIAWAAAQGAEPYEVAATRLLDFVDQFPNSKQASKALLVAGGCFEKCENWNSAAEAYERLISIYPETQDATSATSHLLRLRPSEPLSSDLIQLLKRTVNRSDSIPQTHIDAIAIAAAMDVDEGLWAKLMASIEQLPSCGIQVARSLARLDTQGFTRYSERLATHVLSSRTLRQNLSVVPHSESCPIEQSCRWAAKHGHWNLLAIAGQESVREGTYERLTSLSLRLMAEGAMQSKDLETAKPLLEHLITQRRNQDFDTLLRRAEIAISLDTKDVAAQSIEVARMQAKSAIDSALVSVLQAQWFIRDARMIDARETLERVLRSIDVSDAVKARARWLMGETYYLQRQFAEAVNHYRLVETLDTEGDWTAVAMVQAGRCFEELGRDREAAVCYTGLITRFGNSPHLQIAQQRLAALGSKRSGDSSQGGSGRNTQLR